MKSDPRLSACISGGHAVALRWFVGAFFVVAFGVAVWAGPTDAELVIDASQPAGPIDLTRYALGQGGLSDRPMFDAHVEQVAQLHPQTIRIFVQEFFNLYPERGRYHWNTLDKMIETILATKAKPILCLCESADPFRASTARNPLAGNRRVTM